MTLISKPPHRASIADMWLGPTLFLGGSIEMGDAPDWQALVTPRVQEYISVIFNPRRDDWDTSWEQSIHNPNFTEQVTWEIDHIEKAEIVLFHFVPGTKSPITLLELGLAAQFPHKVVVSCPEGYWRKGNVELVSNRYGYTFCHDLDAAIDEVIRKARLMMPNNPEGKMKRVNTD